jgi:hypothetical protein
MVPYDFDDNKDLGFSSYSPKLQKVQDRRRVVFLCRLTKTRLAFYRGARTYIESGKLRTTDGNLSP